MLFLRCPHGTHFGADQAFHADALIYLHHIMVHFNCCCRAEVNNSRSTRYILLYQYKSLLASLTIIPCSPGTGPEQSGVSPAFLARTCSWNQALWDFRRTCRPQREARSPVVHHAGIADLLGPFCIIHQSLPPHHPWLCTGSGTQIRRHRSHTVPECL